MIHEYAVEPESLADWNQFRYLIEKFGISHGRLISRFPGDWSKKVRECCKSFTFQQKKKLEQKIRGPSKRKFLVNSCRDYDGSKSWIENAIDQYQPNGKPFRAVIVKDAPDDSDYFLVANDIFDDTPGWYAPRETMVPRTAHALGEAVSLLLKTSNQIMFIDKYFTPEEERWKATLNHFINLATMERRLQHSPSFEYHFEFDRDGYGQPAEEERTSFLKECEKHLKPLLPPGIQLTLKRWTPRHAHDDFFHARYILTDIGGIRIDWGLDCGKAGTGQQTDVSLLDEAHWEERYKCFAVPGRYQLMGMTTIEGI